MPTYTWKTQYSENYPDQFQQKGSIDREKAIEEFQFFPWDKEIDDYKRSNNNPTIPKIIFSSDNQRELLIESVSTKGYNLEYSNLESNKYSDFYISNDFEKKNFTVEEIIELFFDNDLEQHIKLKDISQPVITQVKQEKKKKTPEITEFNFNPQHFKTLGAFTFMWLGLSLAFIALDQYKKLGTSIFLHFILALTWLPSFILHITYYLKNYSAKVIIDTENHELTYIKGSKEIKFNREDIFRCQVTSVNSGRSSWSNYCYVWFILHDKTYVSITCLIADPHEIVETLNCKFEEANRMLPFLPL